MELYLVTDRTWLNGNLLENQVEEAMKNGVTFVQIREKKLQFEEFVSQAKKIKEITDKYSIPFVINDNIDVMLAVDADGVHIGQNDLELKKCRELLGDDKIIGVSTQTVEQAINAQKNGADYLGVGAVFSTSTKLDANNVSFDTVRAICEAVSIPVVAIGGISKDNLLELKGTGIDGVAVVSAILAAKEIDKATANLKELVKGL